MVGIRRENFLKEDLEIAHSTKALDGVDFESAEVSLAYMKIATLTLYVKGKAAECSKDVIFNFITRDSIRGTWDTKEYLSLRLAADGENIAQRTVPITADFEKIKILSIQNQESVAGRDVEVNVSIFIK